MTDKRKQIQVGVFALVALGLAGLVLVVFGGLRFWQHRDHYLVVLDDTVIGLTEGAQVYRNGIQVGTVDKITLAPDDLSRVRVEIAIAEGTPIHTDTQAFLSLAGITGLKVIDLKGGTLTAPLVPPGGQIAQGQGTLDKLQAKAEMLADETGRIMRRADEIVDGANRVMANLTEVTDPRQLGAIVASTRETTDNLAATSRDLKAAVAEDRTALRDTLASVQQATQHASDLVDHQVGALVGNANDLVADLRGIVHTNGTSLQATLADIRQASRSFKDLAREVREKPSRLLFSSAAPERKLP